MTHDEFHNQMNAFLAGGLSDAERAAFAAHAAGCPACAAALEQAEAADRELDDLFAAARPGAGLEDRVVARLRAVRRPPMVLHPLVRRAAVGVAATILLGGAGFAVTRAEQEGSSLFSFLDPTGEGVQDGQSTGGIVRDASNLRPMFRSALRDNRSAQAVTYDDLSGGVETPAEMARRFADAAAQPAPASVPSLKVEAGQNAQTLWSQRSSDAAAGAVQESESLGRGRVAAESAAGGDDRIGAASGATGVAVANEVRQNIRRAQSEAAGVRPLVRDKAQAPDQRGLRERLDSEMTDTLNRSRDAVEGLAKEVKGGTAVVSSPALPEQPGAAAEGGDGTVKLGAAGQVDALAKQHAAEGAPAGGGPAAASASDAVVAGKPAVPESMDRFRVTAGDLKREPADAAGVAANGSAGRFKPADDHWQFNQPQDSTDAVLLPGDDSRAAAAAEEGRQALGWAFGIKDSDEGEKLARGQQGQGDLPKLSELDSKAAVRKGKAPAGGNADGDNFFAPKPVGGTEAAGAGDSADAPNGPAPEPDDSVQDSDADPQSLDREPTAPAAGDAPAADGQAPPAAEKKPAVEMPPADEAKPDAEPPPGLAKPAGESQPGDTKPAAESSPDAEAKPADEPQPDADTKPDAAVPAQEPASQPPAQVQAPEAAEELRKAELTRQAARKIIRNGDMSFEVDGYDSSVVQITKIAAEEGGFVATTESEKLPNGKVRGSVVVRVPPERLDTLVLKLRGLGDLKNSRISAQDVTKQFTDLEAQLKAATTMEKRLLQIIESGKGEVKDLLEAEKQLGTWRERIETLQGEINYYGNLVSLSTLTVTLVERDIRTSALLSESEQVNMGIEAADVEEARTAALKAIDDAKGRVVESDLKTLEAGQFSATITAEIAPDAAGAVIDRLKQVGRVARLEVQRRRETAEGAPPAPGARLERKDTRLQLSIYNLANVAARNTTNLALAAEDVEKAYRAVIEQITSAGGRVVNSQLAKPTPEQTTGTITFEAPTEAADVLLGAVRGAGEVMRLESNINPDTQNSTDAKRGFSVEIQSLATVPPRETTTLRVAARDVAAAFNALRDAVRGANGRILTSQLTEQDGANVTGQLDFEVRREDFSAVETALTAAGVVLSRNVTRSADAQNTVDTKVLLQVALADERTVPPRETVTLSLAVDDVATKYEALLEALREVGGARVLVSSINQQDPNNTTATIEFDVRREDRAAVDKALADAGAVYGRTVARPAEGQPAMDEKLRLAVTLNDLDNLAPRETTTLGLEAGDVAGVVTTIEATAISMGGRKVDSDWARDAGGRDVARVVLDVPLAKAPEMLAAAQRQGTRVLTVQREQNPSAPEGSFARGRLSVTVATAESIVQGDQGLAASIKSGLATSVRWLLKSVTLVVIGLCLVAPWVLILWLVWRLVRRSRDPRRIGSTPPAGGPAASPAA